MTRRRLALAGTAIGFSLALGVAASPFIALCLPHPLRYHVYRKLSFRVIAEHIFANATTPEEVTQAATNYINRHLWLFGGSRPYSGKPLDYLIEGVGWCDYAAKVFCKLLAARGLHARYAFLKDRDGVSPHTIAEVYVDGKWRAVDPFFNFRYVTDDGSWLAMEEVSSEQLEAFPAVRLIKTANPGTFNNIAEIARRTLPLPMPPQRSDDFLQDQNLFDGIAALYFKCFGLRFAYWYQDRFLERELAVIDDPLERLWYTARNYHLYRRLHQAEPLYRQLLAQDVNGRYRDRTTLFLSRLLIGTKRFEEASALLEQFVQEKPDIPWGHFHLGLCYESVGESAQAAGQYHEYQRLHGRKFAIEAVQHLNRLGTRI